VGWGGGGMRVWPGRATPLWAQCVHAAVRRRPRPQAADDTAPATPP
jgi:hypothetical protein